MNNMMEAFLPQVLSSHSAITLGMDIAFKATLLLLLAFALDQSFGRRRALIRSTILNACMLGLLILPLTTLAFPPLRIRCLPASADTARLAQEACPEDTLTAAPPPAPTRYLSAVPPWVVLLGTMYAAGVLVCLLRLAMSFIAILRLRRNAAQISEAEWLRAKQRWQQQLGIRRPVVLAVSREVRVPTAIGWLHPVVLLPEAALATSDAGDRDAILLHELAHVRRHDYAWQLLLRIAQVVYWPHPMVWITGRLVTGAREQACDDVCVHHTASPEMYRNALIRAAALLAHRSPVALGMAFARTSGIGRRLEDIEAGCRNAQALPPRTLRASVAALALAGVVTLGPLELARRSEAAAAQPATRSAHSEASPESATQTNNDKPQAPQSALGHVAPATASHPNVALVPASSGPLPSVKVDELVYDFGSVLGVETVKHTYKLRNIGEAELRIDSVTPSCGCTTAGQWAKTVAPGATWELPITLRTSIYDGPVNKHIVVKTNDPAHREIAYVITGTARARFGMKPARTVIFKDLTSDSVTSSTLTITNQTEQPVVLSDAAVSSPSFRANLREITKGKVYELEVTTVPPLVESTTVPNVTIKTDSKDEPIITVQILAAFRPDPAADRAKLSSAPPRLFPNVLNVPQPLDREYRLPLSLMNPGSRPVNVKSVIVSNPAIRTEVRMLQEGKAYSVYVVVPAGTAIPPEGSTVVVVTDDAAAPTLTALVRPPVAEAPATNPS